MNCHRIAIAVLTAVLMSCTPNAHDKEASQGLSAADTCMEDVWKQHGNTQELGCTANDVGIASATNIRGLDGQPLDSCIEGTTFSFVADFHVQLTAQERFDIGLYFATDGDPNADGALTGTCGVNTIAPKDPLTGLGSTNFIQIDQAPDTCGDINGSHNPQIVTVQVDNVLCKAGAGGFLSLPNCTSWRQSGSNGVCDEVSDAFPGAPSKCNCDQGFTVGIAVKPPEAAVTKSLVSHLCSTDRRQIVLRNDSVTQSLSVTQLVDSTFGDLFTVHDAVVATTCAPTVLAVGASTTCTFDAAFCGDSETDTATATFDDGQGTVIDRVSNTLTVNVSATAAP